MGGRLFKTDIDIAVEKATKETWEKAQENWKEEKESWKEEKESWKEERESWKEEKESWKEEKENWRKEKETLERQIKDLQAKNISNLVATGNYDVNSAMNALQIPKEEQGTYIKLLEQSDTQYNGEE